MVNNPDALKDKAETSKLFKNMFTRTVCALCVKLKFGSIMVF